MWYEVQWCEEWTCVWYDQWFEETMYGALSYLSYLEDLGFEEQRRGEVL